MPFTTGVGTNVFDCKRCKKVYRTDVSKVNYSAFYCPDCMRLFDRQASRVRPKTKEVYGKALELGMTQGVRRKGD